MVLSVVCGTEGRSTARRVLAIPLQIGFTEWGAQQAVQEALQVAVVCSAFTALSQLSLTESQSSQLAFSDLVPVL